MSDTKPPVPSQRSGLGSGLRATGRLLAALTAAALRILARAIGGVVAALWGSWRHLDKRRRRIIAALLGLVVIAGLGWSLRDAAYHWNEARQGKRPLLTAKSWFYNLMHVDVENVARQPADLAVIDYERGDTATAPLSKAEVDRLRIKPDGGKRIVVSYMSIGEAESYRFYWKKDWDKDPPGWYVAENCAWPRNYMVRFWHDGWRDIMFNGKDSFLQRIVDAGLDGVYLDRIDVYENLRDERPTARDDMIKFVADLAAKARQLKPGFLVIAQNAEGLLTDRAYRAVIDGLGKEDLLYGVHGSYSRNPAQEIADNLRQIRKLQRDYKPVFAVEYLANPQQIAVAREELVSLGMVPTFAHKGLDGLDPTLPRPPSAIQYGTPEWVEKNCQGKKHW